MNLIFSYEPRQCPTARMKKSPAPKTTDTGASLERYVIPNLRNACRIMKLLAGSADGAKAADIARVLGIPVTTTLRIMATLQLEGYARKVAGRFELGPVLIHLGNASLAGVEIRDAALTVLQKLTADTVETAHLAIPCDDRALIIAVQDGPHPLRVASRPGYLADLHCSSTGKIFLAYLHRDRLDELFGGKPPLRRTANTQVTVEAIRREADLTRKRGYSFDNEEYHPGVRCVAAPVFASDGTVVAAIGITAAVVRFPKERIPAVASRVTEAAASLARNLGYAGREG